MSSLDGGLSMWSADEASGQVNVAVYPWDVSLGSHVPDDSRMNHVSARGRLGRADGESHARRVWGRSSRR